MWNIKNNIITVANEAKLPGILEILPIPNIVINKKFKFLIIFDYWSYYFTSDC